MIQPQDLRIGNAIYHVEDDGNKTETIVQLQHVVWCIDVNEEFNKHYAPIPLTEEVLVKCGFSVRESSTCRQYYIGNNPLTHDWLFDLTWLEKPELINAPNAPFYRNGNHTIYYLHHLQNLYRALTGEELIYKP